MQRLTQKLEALLFIAAADTNLTATKTSFNIGQDFNQVSDPQPIPEPASVLGIMALGALGGGKLLKRKRQQKQAALSK